MKRTILACLICIFTFSSMSACSDNQVKETKKGEEEQMEKDNEKATVQEIEKLKKNSELGLDFFAESELSEKQEKRYNDDLPQTKIIENQVIGYYFRYPDEVKKTRLTQLKVLSSEHAVYGIRVGDDIGVVEKIMENEEYVRIENFHSYLGTNTETYQKADVHLTFETAKEDAKIITILLSVYEQTEGEIS